MVSLDSLMVNYINLKDFYLDSNINILVDKVITWKDSPKTRLGLNQDHTNCVWIMVAHKDKVARQVWKDEVKYFNTIIYLLFNFN